MKKGKVIRVENDIVTIGMNNGSIKEVRRCDLGFDPVLGDLVEIFEDEDQIIVTKAKKEPENHNDAGININMTNSINNASDVAAGNGKKVVNKVAYCLLALFLGGRRCRLLNESNRFSSSSNQTEEQRKIHAEKIQIISSQLPRLIRWILERVDRWFQSSQIGIMYRMGMVVHEQKY